MFARTVRFAAVAAALFVLAGTALAAPKVEPPPPRDETRKGTPLSVEEAKWLKEILDAERNPRHKKEIEEEFKEESGLGRAAIYKLFRKDRGLPPVVGRDPSKKGAPLSAEETRWLKEMVDAEKDAARRKKVEQEFKAESSRGRAAVYRTFKFKKNTPLSAEEAKWLKEMMDAEKDSRQKKEIEQEFKEESSLGRAAIYKLFQFNRDKNGVVSPEPPVKDGTEKGTPLSAEEAKWLKEMMDAEKDPAKKKEIEQGFKEEPSLGRAAIYKLFKAIRDR